MSPLDCDPVSIGYASRRPTLEADGFKGISFIPPSTTDFVFCTQWPVLTADTEQMLPFKYLSDRCLDLRHENLIQSKNFN